MDKRNTSKDMQLNKFRIILLFALLATVSAQGQGTQDLIDLSQYDLTASARNVGLGNAMGAIGGDFSTLTNNPAGIGIYRSTHFAVSSSFIIQRAETVMLDERTKAQRLFPGFDGLSGVLSIGFNPDLKERGLMFLNFGLSYNKLRSFNFRTRVKGTSQDLNTFLDALTSYGNSRQLLPQDLLESADGQSYDPYLSQDWYLVSAYNSYLVQDLVSPSDPTNYAFKSPWEENEDVMQACALDSRGSLDEMDFSIGANISNKFYVGGTLGVQILYRRWTRTITETGLLSTKSHGLLEGKFVENNSETGHGVNLKIGFIYKPIDQLRLGISVHSPTFFSVKTKFNLASYGSFLNPDTLLFEPPTSQTEAKTLDYVDSYNFTGPFHVQASTAFFVKKYGLISFDYDMTYTPGMFFDEDERFGNDNRYISENIIPMHEFRIGTEWYIGPVGLRAGGGYRTSPYKLKGYDTSADRFYFAGGAGFYGKWCYFDLAYRHTIQRGNGMIYDYDGQDGKVFSRSYSQVKSQSLLIATFGFTF